MAKVCMIMTGLPGCGKSTFRNKVLGHAASVLQEAYPAWTAHSSDDEVEAHAKNLGKTYNEVWPTYKEEAELRFWTKLEHAKVFGDQMIIVDRTNLSKKSRKRIIDAIGPEYKFVSLYVTCNEEERAARNAARIGKEIPKSIVENMKKTLEEPGLGEGFDLLLSTDTSSRTIKEGINPKYFSTKYVYEKLIDLIRNS